MKTVQKTPILIVTSDSWSSNRYVVFEGDQIILPDDWVQSAYEEELEHGVDVTREQVEEAMESDFFSENTHVDEFWPEHGICRSGNDYYSYDNDGMCEYIDEDEALEIMQEAGK